MTTSKATEPADLDPEHGEGVAGPPPAGRPWPGPDAELVRVVDTLREQRLENYRNLPGDVTEHANIELRMREHGYRGRQVYELVQNAAYAAVVAASDGYIELVLVEGGLYAANTGAPLDRAGVEALLSSHRSPKGGRQIGRFGLGFKSVTGLSNHPQVHSRSVSIAFDGARASKAIQDVASLPASARTPILRLGWILDTPHWFSPRTGRTRSGWSASSSKSTVT